MLSRTGSAGLPAGRVRGTEMQDAGCQAGTQDGARVHHGTREGAPFETYKLLLSGSFHLIFSDRSQCQVTETLESETVDEVGQPWSSADAEEAAAFERCPGSFSHRRCGKS